MLTTGRIIVLSPLAVANGFVRHLPRLIRDSFGSHEPAPKRHLARFDLFRTSHPYVEIVPTCQPHVVSSFHYLIIAFAAYRYSR